MEQELTSQILTVVTTAMAVMAVAYVATRIFGPSRRESGAADMMRELEGLYQDVRRGRIDGEAYVRDAGMIVDGLESMLKESDDIEYSDDIDDVRGHMAETVRRRGGAGGLSDDDYRSIHTRLDRLRWLKYIDG